MCQGDIPNFKISLSLFLTSSQQNTMLVYVPERYTKLQNLFRSVFLGHNLSKPSHHLLISIKIFSSLSLSLSLGPNLPNPPFSIPSFSPIPHPPRPYIPVKGLCKLSVSHWSAKTTGQEATWAVCKQTVLDRGQWLGQMDTSNKRRWTVPLE